MKIRRGMNHYTCDNEKPIELADRYAEANTEPLVDEVDVFCSCIVTVTSNKLCIKCIDISELEVNAFLLYVLFQNSTKIIP